MTNDLKTGGQTPTPRTDAHLLQTQTSPGPNLWASADFARMLERELTEAKRDIESLSSIGNKINSELADALAAHAEDRAMLETLRAFVLQMAGAPDSQVSAFVRAACSAALSNQLEPKLPPGDPLKTILALTAQLDAARRERDEANTELDRARGLIVQALDSAETHSENTRTAIAGIAKLQSIATQRMAELVALRAELEAVKQERLALLETSRRSIVALKDERDALNQLETDLRARLDAAKEDTMDVDLVALRARLADWQQKHSDMSDRCQNNEAAAKAPLQNETQP